MRLFTPAPLPQSLSPSKATFGSNDVLGLLLVGDGNYAKMSPGDKMLLEFPVALLSSGSVRDFVFVSKGYYVPKSGSYLIYTWDGTNWVQRDGHSYTSSDTSRDFDLSLFLPEPSGKYRVRIWQDYQYEGAGINYVKLMAGGVQAPLLSAFDYRTNANVTSKVATADGLYTGDPGRSNGWYYCPRNRIVDAEFTPPGPVNIPPTVNPVVATNVASFTPTISWTYADADSDLEVKSEVQVWTGSGATGVILWNPPEFAGAGTSVVYAGAALQNGITYYARVRANDGKDWGPWSESAFTISASVCGDLNGDGLVTTADYTIFRSAFGTKLGQASYNAAADMDGDGWVSLKDYASWYACYVKYR